MTNIFSDKPSCIDKWRVWRKTWMIMRLTVLLIIISTLTVSAKSYSQKVTLSLQDVPVESAFRQISDQTGYAILWTKEAVKGLPTISVSVRKVSLKRAVEACLKELPLTYGIRGNVVYIKCKLSRSLRLDSPEGALLRLQEVTGTVTDSATGAPLAGVTIKVKGSPTGTTTDDNGQFSLEVPDDAVLIVSYLGYTTEEIPVNGRTSFNISLVATTTGLNQLVVVGYGTQKKKDITGAIDVVSANQLEQRPAPTVSQLLVGTSPGLNFSVDQRGFEPGATMDINIRGIGSINGGSPYVLIDGFPGNLNDVNPQDIKSISILKDAAAAAIYGAQAAYGVILITTKDGKRNGKINVEYNAQVILKNPPTHPHSLNSYTWARVLNEAGRNGGGSPISNETIDRIIWYQNKEWDSLRQSMQYWPEGATHFGAFPKSPTTWDHAGNNYANTDWWDVLYSPSVHQKHNLSVSGGSNSTSYYLSLGYLNDGDVLTYGIDNYKRINLLGKVHFKIRDWWNLEFQTRANQIGRIESSIDHRSDINGLFQKMIQFGYPSAPLRGGFGNYIQASHIPVILHGGKNHNNRFLQTYLLKTNLTPLKGWDIHAYISYDRSTGTIQNNQLAVFVPTPTLGVRNLFGPSTPTVVNRIESDAIEWSAKVYSSYQWNIKHHNFYIMGGMQFLKGRFNQIEGSKTDIVSRSVPSLQTALGQPVLIGSLAHHAREGFFSRFRYNYKEKYYLEINDRYDGTYVFRRGHQWGFFPSFSVGWRVDQEPFWNKVDGVINTLKIRGSWGELGNQNLAPYTDLPLIPLHSTELPYIFNYGGTRPVGYTTAPPLVNSNLTWETARTTNVGINMSFLNERLRTDLDLFQRSTSIWLEQVSLNPAYWVWLYRKLIILP